MRLDAETASPDEPAIDRDGDHRYGSTATLSVIHVAERGRGGREVAEEVPEARGDGGRGSPIKLPTPTTPTT